MTAPPPTPVRPLKVPPAIPVRTERTPRAPGVCSSLATVVAIISQHDRRRTVEANLIERVIEIGLDST